MVESSSKIDTKSQKSTKVGKYFALMPADESLKGPEITRAWSFPTGSVRKIEQVGEGYEKLKKKHSEMWERV